MGSRDFRHRETKKPKKDAKKVSAPIILSTPASIEVIKKGKKERKEEED